MRRVGDVAFSKVVFWWNNNRPQLEAHSRYLALHSGGGIGNIESPVFVDVTHYILQHDTLRNARKLASEFTNYIVARSVIIGSPDCLGGFGRVKGAEVGAGVGGAIKVVLRTRWTNTRCLCVQ